MGELTTLGFIPGRSPLHRVDPRTKQALLMILSLVGVWGGLPFLVLLSVTMIALLAAAGLRVLHLVREMRYFLLFLLFVFAVRTVTFGDGWIPAVAWGSTGEAALVCWRLLTVVCMGLMLVATTRIADIRAALVWYLRPIPLIDEKKAATMVGLVVRFLPLILHQASEIADAQRARGIDRCRNPLSRLMKFTTPLFQRVFLSADELAAAMQARCYNDERTLRDLAFGWPDCLALGTGLLIASSTLISHV
jgi:energy-coupling factor transporter transmembrane protein EcfT